MSAPVGGWRLCDGRGPDEPRDQERDLFGPYWAEIGEDERYQPGGWSWSILDSSKDNAVVVDGYVAGEAAAKQAVSDWEEDDAEGEQLLRG